NPRLRATKGTAAAPIPDAIKDPDLLSLVEADPAKTLASKLLRNAAGLQAFLAKHGGEQALKVMVGILWRHAVVGKPIGSVKSWNFFKAAVIEEQHKRMLQEQGVRPGDFFGAHKKWRSGDA